MLRKQLFLVLLALALAWVPVLHAAHALTHVGEITSGDIVSELETMEDAAVKGVIPPVADEADGEADNDRLCLDCLALTGFSVIFSILVIVFSSQTRRQARLYRKSQPLFFNSYTPYSTRGPPAQASRT
ncbi:MAG: hypothetical protein ABS69_16685 [Nitrosomonadales bacterium SCN 54-20]|nr:MAG: hypothetical protein ABS69_16685 [Nitrosomonadales bacterium SCN 54-20]